LAAVVERFFPYATRRVKKGSVCMYTKTPDEDFIIDRHPEHGHVLIVSACSGHGFKFASAIGEIAAQWTLTGKATLDVSAFKMDRFI
jgi:glycine/D-amino acid oxidase-like deaminating enzyme